MWWGISSHGMDMYISGIDYKNPPRNHQKVILNEFLDKHFKCVKIGPYENSWYPSLPCHYKG